MGASSITNKLNVEGSKFSRGLDARYPYEFVRKLAFFFFLFLFPLLFLSCLLIVMYYAYPIPRVKNYTFFFGRKKGAQEGRKESRTKGLSIQQC